MAAQPNMVAQPSVVALHLAPGTVVTTLPGPQGVTIAAVIQADGSLGWQALPAAPSVAPPAPAPAVAPPAKPPRSHGKASVH